MKPFWVYILRCADGSYYTGHTDNLEHRIGQHQIGECDGYTATRRPIELAWSQECVTRDEALAAEGSMPFRVERNDLISSWPERTDDLADA